MRTNKSWKSIILLKLLLAFMVLVAPLYIIGLTINMIGQSRLKEELTASQHSKTSFYLDMLESEGEHMINLLQEYVIDKDLHHLTYLNGTMTQFEFTEVIRRVQSKLVQLKGSSVYADTVSAHILTLQRSLSSEVSINSTLNDDFKTVEDALQISRSGLYHSDDMMFLAIAYPGPAPSDYQSGFILSIKLDESAIIQMLRMFQSREHSTAGAALISPQREKVISDYENQSLLDVTKSFLKSKHEAGMRKGAEILEFNNQNMMISYAYSPLLDLYLTAFIPIDEMLGPVDTLNNLLWILSFCSLIVIVAFSYWVYRQIHSPLRNLVKAFRKVENGLLAHVDLPRSNDEFLYLYQRFNTMIDKLNELIHQVYEQKLRVQSSELKQLQSQINPHFLFNTYFILYRLAKKKDHYSIERFVQYLGEYFQYITRNAADDITLEQEFQHSQTYAQIQNIRFQGRIVVEFEPLPEDWKSVLVPRLSLQPIFENAYKHGLESLSRQGCIRISLKEYHSMLHVVVEDNGDRISNEMLYRLIHSLKQANGLTEHTGLLNVHRRLQIRFGPEAGIEVSNSSLGGLQVTMKVSRGGRVHVQDADRR